MLKTTEGDHPALEKEPLAYTERAYPEEQAMADRLNIKELYSLSMKYNRVYSSILPDKTYFNPTKIDALFRSANEVHIIKFVISLAKKMHDSTGNPYNRSHGGENSIHYLAAVLKTPFFKNPHPYQPGFFDCCRTVPETYEEEIHKLLAAYKGVPDDPLFEL